jgi:porin
VTLREPSRIVILKRIALRLCGSLMLLWAPPALAQTQAAAPATPPPAGFWERQNLLGDIGGLRPFLDDHGLTLSLSETSEMLGNLTGGLRRGFEYAGLTTMSLTLDTTKAFGWPGGTFYASALQIHGRNLSADNLAVLQTITNIEATPATRLWELWFKQSLFGDKADVKIGQQSLDQEFILSQYAQIFLISAMGWPALPAIDLYAGSPVYPLSSLGVRVRAKPSSAVTLLAGVFDDNPPGGPFSNDSQVRDGEASGTRFNLGTGALFIGELQYSAARPPFAAPAVDLPGSYKLGLWVDTGEFPDQRFDTAGLSLASPASTGMPRQHRGDFSVYGIVDQQVWKAAQDPRRLGVFLRIMGAPADRNLVDWSANAGFNLKAPFPGRPDDTVGLGYDWAHVSSRVSAFDRDVQLFTLMPYPVRGSEHVVELTYQYQAAPWWIVQPDLQYVINPGGGIPNPNDPSRVIGNELVIGVRTIITF